MTVSTEITDLLAPLIDAPLSAAILLDVDGTLAPIVRNADDAHVPESTRRALAGIARSYGLAACVSGRRAAVARRIVSLGTMTYVGNHGAEILRAGSAEPETAPEAVRYRDQVQRFARIAMASEAVPRVRLRGEDKSVIYAFHWRGAPDEGAAEGVARTLAGRAEQEGLAVHWGRKVMEIRPPVEITKGTGLTALLGGRPDITAALYIGDDLTDVDAFAALRAMRAAGSLEQAVCLGVRSAETPAQLERDADAMADGPDGVREILELLAGGH